MTHGFFVQVQVTPKQRAILAQHCKDSGLPYSSVIKTFINSLPVDSIDTDIQERYLAKSGQEDSKVLP